MHFGCFEYFVQLLAICATPIAFIVRPFGMRRLDAYITSIRELHGCQVLFRDGGFTEMQKTISEGTTVGILSDQNVKKNHATFVDFFGIQVATSKAVALAALRTKCPVVLVTSTIEDDGRIRIICEEVPVPTEGSKKEKIDSLSRNMHIEMENVIRHRPGHWFWIHRRFKTRPPGEDESLYSS
jgi:KDO2-lipid IV(A) lauroyltransferase